MIADVKIAAHPYGYVRVLHGGDLYRAAPLIFADIKLGGYDGIELLHTMLEPEGAEEEMLALSEHNELQIIGSSFGGNFWDPELSDEWLRKTERIAAQIAGLGGFHLGISTGSTGQPKTDEQLDTQAAVVRQMIDICAAEGVVLNAHNHTYEVDWGQHELRGMLKRIPGLKLGPDLNWLRMAGLDPWQFVREHGDRIVFMHLRPQRDDAWVQTLQESDDEWLTLPEIIDDIDFSGWVAMELAFRAEHPVTRPMGENYRLCAEQLRAVLKQEATA